SFRGTWLFLLHRPAPREALLLTKLAAGIVLLLVAALVPLLFLALWAAVPGTHASPFDWRMTEHPLRLTFASTTLFLAAWLTGLREARWYFSRLFPLVPAALLFLATYFTPRWPFVSWIALVVADLLYLSAIRSVAQVREYP